jgi:rubrerythrin
MNYKAALTFGRATKEVLKAMADGDFMANRLVYNSVRKLVDAINKQDENAKVEAKGRVAPHTSGYFSKLADQVQQLIDEYTKTVPPEEMDKPQPMNPETLPEIGGWKRRRARLPYKCDGCSDTIKIGGIHFHKSTSRICPACYITTTNAKEGR